MTYRGVVSNGVVLIEGEKPADGTVVEITPVDQPVTNDLTSHPAIGVWRDRTDLPDDATLASDVLRKKLMTRDDE